MSKSFKYVKDFSFPSDCGFTGSAGRQLVKGYMRGGYMQGGKACDAPGYARGGVKEKATGESYSSRSAMMKHERMESPRMQREEVMKRAVAKDVAPKGGPGMLRNRGSLGVMMNKNPGETRMHTAPNLPGSTMMKKGGLNKVSRVMGEFGRGQLHSGSKKGPLVKNPKQAVAIALSEARRAKK